MSLKRFYYLLSILLVSSSVFVSCSHSEDDLIGDWQHISNLTGKERSSAVCFVLDNVAYLGTGFDEDEKVLKDFWQYNTDGNFWTQVAAMPDSMASAVAFAAAGYGFVGTGLDNDKNRKKEFYKYDSDANSWTQIADFPGGARYGAIAFAVNDMGYVGTGKTVDGNQNDFYRYDPSSDTWTVHNGYGGPKKTEGSVFVIGKSAYFVGGDLGGASNNEFWKFDGTTESWTKLRDISDSEKDEDFDDEYTSIARSQAVAFAINGKGYLATGANGSALSTVWEYDPSTDLWEEKTGYQGTTRVDAVGFSIGNYGYVATGRSGSTYLDEIGRFDPTAEDDEDYY